MRFPTASLRFAGLALLLGFGIAAARAQSVVVQTLRGEVSVRHGVTEQWLAVAAGDVLRPEDSMRTGPKGSAVIVTTQVSGTKRIALPADVMVDVADIRDLTPNELMLRLTMEKVRSSSYRSKDLPEIPNAAIVHGAEGGDKTSLRENPAEAALLQWNGINVLFNNGFYSSCVLKGMELFRLYPQTAQDFHYRSTVAQALERASLRSEALNEYSGMLALPQLTASQSSWVHERISALRQEIR